MAATAAPDSLAGHVSVMHQLNDSYDAAADVERVHEADLLHAELVEICEANEDRIRDVIKELQREVRGVEQAAQPPEPAGAYPQRMAALSSAAKEAQENVAGMTRDARYALASTQALQASTSHTFLAEQREGLKERQAGQEALSASAAAEAANAEPQLRVCLVRRHALSLYSHISSITWKYDDQARSAGSVSDRSLHDIRSFDVDAAEATTFAGVNRLWEIIG